MTMKYIVPVVSGKGGVGKSTVAVNLAIGLSLTGARVALIDSDFYGPSIPTLMGGGQVISDHEGQLVPPVKHGIKYVSLGFFLRSPDDAVIWRGPMFNKALAQLFQDVNWGEIDYCIVDMPPGTGDAQISLTQMLKLAGAVVVTTPQEVALADVRKAVSMLKRVEVPILGVVENMAGYKLADGTEVPIFGSGGGKTLAAQLGVELLAQIPIDLHIREGGDKGAPVVLDGSTPAGALFRELALKLKGILDTSASAESEVRIVN